MADSNGHSPLEQFTIKKLWNIEIGGVDVSFTNSSLMMIIVLALVTVFMIAGMRRRALVPGRLQSMVELCYEFIANMLRDTIGPDGRKYFPLIFTLFMFVLFGNMLGMIPYSFTFTSHIAVTFAMAMIVFIGVTILGFVKHGVHFFSFFLPPGVSILLWPLMIPIEIISYLSRPISLAVRLFANMTAGHTMLKVFAGFVPSLASAGAALVPVSVITFAFVVGLTGLELLIAFLQAYVFTVLTCLYISDALHLH